MSLFEPNAKSRKVSSFNAKILSAPRTQLYVYTALTIFSMLTDQLWGVLFMIDLRCGPHGPEDVANGVRCEDSKDAF